MDCNVGLVILTLCWLNYVSIMLNCLLLMLFVRIEFELFMRAQWWSMFRDWLNWSLFLYFYRFYEVGYLMWSWNYDVWSMILFQVMVYFSYCFIDVLMLIYWNWSMVIKAWRNRKLDLSLYFAIDLLNAWPLRHWLVWLTYTDGVYFLLIYI